MIKHSLAVVLGLLFVGLFSAHAQQTELLLIESQTGAVDFLSPLGCIGQRCERVAAQIYPSLLNIDPQTEWVAPADVRGGVVASWEQTPDGITYTLADQYWSNGNPISAYDVLYSYIVLRRGYWRQFPPPHLRAVALEDERTIHFEFDTPSCRAITAANMPVVPAPANFADTLAQAGISRIEAPATNQVLPWFPHDAGSRYLAPEVTGGGFYVSERRFADAIQLRAVDGALDWRFTPLRSGMSAEDVYLRGETNLIVNPRYNRRADLRADETSIIHSFEGNRAFFIALNPIRLEDERAEPHPLLTDRAVRDALQRALDVPAIIDAALEGDGVPLGSALSPAALGYDAALVAAPYDVIGARQILHDSGWRDTDRNGIRECVRCTTAEIGTPLYMTLATLDNSDALSVETETTLNIIQRQFSEIGVSVQLTFVTPENLLRGEFDMLLITHSTSTEAVRVLQALATLGEDQAVLRSLSAADTAPNCDPATRSAAYQDAMRTLYNEQTHLWLFSPNRMLVTRVAVPPSNRTWEFFVP